MASLLYPPPPPGFPPSFPPSPGRGADDAFGVIMIGNGILCLMFILFVFTASWPHRREGIRQKIFAKAETPPSQETSTAAYNGQSFFEGEKASVARASKGMNMPQLQDASFRSLFATTSLSR